MSDKKMFYDPKMKRFVNESVVQFQFEFFINEPWFRMSYEKFCSENFVIVPEEEIEKMKKMYCKIADHAA